eukprot:GHRR01028806.1.p3 GENE.GHRR01028806.1~~GHRR01028806.1.p3  ORF type:complete len:103 (+),score=26.25 GHRR01028806.1:636-944(+)
MTYAKTTGKYTNFDTAVDVAYRPGSYVPKPGGKWPADKQGYTVLQHADTLEQYGKHSKQWVKYEVTFRAPENKVTIAFINAKRPKECGSCGSLLDAVCLRKA